MPVFINYLFITFHGFFIIESNPILHVIRVTTGSTKVARIFAASCLLTVSECTIHFQYIPYEILPGDDMYEYTCFRCTHSSEDTLFRYKLNWYACFSLLIL